MAKTCMGLVPLSWHEALWLAKAWAFTNHRALGFLKFCFQNCWWHRPLLVILLKLSEVTRNTDLYHPKKTAVNMNCTKLCSYVTFGFLVHMQVIIDSGTLRLWNNSSVTCWATNVCLLGDMIDSQRHRDLDTPGSYCHILSYHRTLEHW